MLLELKLLLLIGIANGIPVLTKKQWGEKYNWPMDGGKRFVDGQPLLGPSKTLRGVILSVSLTPLAAILVGFHWEIGLLIGLFAMFGDLFSSFIKRRLRRPSSSMALGLDQIPESFFPLLACQASLSLSWTSIAFMVLLFFIGELVISRILFKFNLRDTPY